MHYKEKLIVFFENIEKSIKEKVEISNQEDMSKFLNIPIPENGFSDIVTTFKENFLVVFLILNETGQVVYKITPERMKIAEDEVRLNLKDFKENKIRFEKEKKENIIKNLRKIEENKKPIEDIMESDLPHFSITPPSEIEKGTKNAIEKVEETKITSPIINSVELSEDVKDIPINTIGSINIPDINKRVDKTERIVKCVRPSEEKIKQFPPYGVEPKKDKKKNYGMKTLSIVSVFVVVSGFGFSFFHFHNHNNGKVHEIVASNINKDEKIDNALKIEKKEKTVTPPASLPQKKSQDSTSVLFSLKPQTMPQ